MSFFHGLSSHLTKSCLYNADETTTTPATTAATASKNNQQQQQQDSANNDRANSIKQQSLYRTSSLVVSQANTNQQPQQEQQLQQQQINVRMRRHPELVPVMPRERDLGISTSRRNNNIDNNGCSNSSSLTRPNLRANNNIGSGSTTSSSSSRNHPMSSSYMGQQQIFKKQNSKDTFAKPQPKRCVSMTRLDQLAQPKRIFSKDPTSLEATQPKPSPSRVTPVRLKSASTTKSSLGPTSKRPIPKKDTQVSKPPTTTMSNQNKLASSEHMSITNDPISSQPEIVTSSPNSSTTTSTMSPVFINPIKSKPNKVSPNNGGSSLFDELSSDSPNSLNKSKQDAENLADSTLVDFQEIQPESPVLGSDNSISINEIIQNDLKNFNSSLNDLCADMSKTSIMSSVYHSPSSFQTGNQDSFQEGMQESFQSIIDTTVDTSSKNIIQVDTKPKVEDNQFLLRIKKEDEEKRLREEEELKEQLRKEEEEREARKRILDNIMRRVSKPTTPKSGQDTITSNGTLNEGENGNLDSSGTIINVEPIEAPVNY